MKGTEPISITPQDVNDAVAAAFPGPKQSSCVDLGGDFAVVRLDVQTDVLRPGGFVSGPTQFAAIDAALWYLTFGVVDRIELMALTSDVDVTFLRPAAGAVLWTRADLLSAGSRKIVGSARVWCDDQVEKPTAVAKGAYVLPRSEP